MPLSDAASIGSGGVKRGSQGPIGAVTESYRECFPISISRKRKMDHCLVHVLELWFMGNLTN